MLTNTVRVSSMVFILLLLGVAVSWATAPPPNVAHWSFNDEADPGHDSVNGHDATLSSPNGPVWDNGALSFDGVDDYVVALDSAEEFLMRLDSYSIMVCFRTPYSAPAPIVLRSGSGAAYSTNFRIDIQADGTCFGAHEIDGTEDIVVYTDPNFYLMDGNWHEIILAYDATSELMSIYRDGVLDDTETGPPSAYPDYLSYRLTIGSNSLQQQFFTGQIDYVKLYDYAIPEPATLSLLAVGSLLLIRRRAR
jgi:hypothetical protein